MTERVRQGKVLADLQVEKANVEGQRKVAEADLGPVSGAPGLKQAAGATMTEPRIAIVCDGSKWHVRRIASIEDDRVRGEMVYRCDLPISNDHDTLAAAVRSAVAYMESEVGGPK